jgi:hypothetical protein
MFRPYRQVTVTILLVFCAHCFLKIVSLQSSMYDNFFKGFADVCFGYRLKTPVNNALRDAKLSVSDLDEVILVGGSTRIPAVQELVRKLTDKDPNVTVNPDEVVSLGAAVQVIFFILKCCLLLQSIILTWRAPTTTTKPFSPKQGW